jgi:AcrR family transcriptional regulator
MTGRQQEPALRSDARRNRDSLVAVARQVIAEEGTEASLRDVARRAGVGIGTLYRHFPTREALLEAVVRDGFDALRALADRMLEEEPSPRAALSAWLSRFSANSGGCRGLSGSVLAGLKDRDSELHASSEAMHLAATRLLARAQEAGEVRDDVTATDLITMAAAAGWVAQISGEEQSGRMLDVIMDGLAPVEG